ncbi:unnamed protein product [Acanthoscelides obtectus]|uniref:Uncharacterized protein n=1 Tax=Acanthoscelides obtectus TaxID=200917 RepID=A0A9P0PEJ8_ACAOB|nr:unnamed protein product [Acanthoscelides obtectus]CAK1643367.1 Zinc finger matrin-type protein CG9776 [Acanthoscelides obtectus]
MYNNVATQPVPPGDGFTATNWTTTTTPTTSSDNYTTVKTDAVVKEMEQQKAQLTKQREEYVRKVSVLRRELDQLRLQKTQLMGSSKSSDRDISNILKENDKLQRKALIYRNGLRNPPTSIELSTLEREIRQRIIHSENDVWKVLQHN